MAGAIDATLRKFHASLNVSDLDRSIAFYRVLLGAEPAKVRSDYAKFDLAEPPLVLSLIPGRPGAGGHLNHVGLRVRNAEELVEIQRRLEAAGMPTKREEGVECCYARQTKFWITDPDGALWEIYVFHDDIDDHGSAAPPRVGAIRVETATSPAPLALGASACASPIPARIPHDDNSLHEVRLEGSINVAPEADNRPGLLAEALRALRPGAPSIFTAWPAIAACASSPKLPGPAAAVQHVPAAGEVVDDLARAGFVDIQIEKLSETAYFVVDGVPMRELRIVARKPGYRPATASHQAVYLGPMAQVIDDFGNVFRRGVPTPLNVHDWQVLSKSAASGAFLFLKPDRPEGEGLLRRAVDSPRPASQHAEGCTAACASCRQAGRDRPCGGIAFGAGAAAASWLAAPSGALELEAAAAQVQNAALGGAPTDRLRQRVKAAAAALLDLEQTGFTQDAQMFRDVVLRDPEPLRNFADVERLVDQQADDADPGVLAGRQLVHGTGRPRTAGAVRPGTKSSSTTRQVRSRSPKSRAA